ncbi:hypothetical protein PERCYII40_2396 [Pseudomonas aeruginosa]|nr:hypothetical protein PERCYII40_2396 [Pseudomonas aeruginosa]
MLLLHMNYGRTCQTYFHFQISTLGKQLSPSPPPREGSQAGWSSTLSTTTAGRASQTRSTDASGLPASPPQSCWL